MENLFKHNIRYLEYLIRKKYKINNSDPEAGGRTYLRNVGNTADVHAVQNPMIEMNNNGPP
jgi:hypothetical protein